MPNEGFGDGRISLAAHIKELMSVNDRMNAERFEAIIKRLDAMEKSHHNDINGLGQRVRVTENAVTEHGERWIGHKEEHKRENRIMMAISGIGSAIAGFLGIAVKTP